MKIAIIIPTFPYPKRGLPGLYGHERYTENLAINLKKQDMMLKLSPLFGMGVIEMIIIKESPF